MNNGKKTVDLDLYKQLYYNYESKPTMCKILKVSEPTLTRIEKEQGWSRDKTKVTSKALLNSEAKHEKHNRIKSRVTKEMLYQYYVVEDHYYEEVPKHFGITENQFYQLCKEYGIEKDRVKAGLNGYKTVIDKYGSDNAYNWKKGWETRIQNYGSLKESYRLTYEKAKATCLERYGSECVLNSDYMNSNRKHKNTLPNKNFKNKLLAEGIVIDKEEFVIGTKSYDFKVGNKLIEINPTITHNSDWIPYGDHTPQPKKYHLDKSKLASDNGYSCIHVWDWDDPFKIISLLKHRETAYARSTIIKEVSLKDAKQYLNKYHLQGYARDSIRIGLYYRDELVSLMTFGKPRYNNNYEYELIRYCSHFNVVGGAQKLFKHFISLYKPNSIISYCDNSKFVGTVYSELGFSLKRNSTPACHWYNIETNTHITDNLLRQRGFDQLFQTHYGKGIDNEQLMLEHGFYRVYDCGQNVWT